MAIGASKARSRPRSLSTKIKTPRSEDVTIPNAVVVSTPDQLLALRGRRSVLVPTTVTIGTTSLAADPRALLLPQNAQRRLSEIRRRWFCRRHYRTSTCNTRCSSPSSPHLRAITLGALRATSRMLSTSLACRLCSPIMSRTSAPKVVRAISGRRTRMAPRRSLSNRSSRPVPRTRASHRILTPFAIASRGVRAAGGERFTHMLEASRGLARVLPHRTKVSFGDHSSHHQGVKSMRIRASIQSVCCWCVRGGHRAARTTAACRDLGGGRRSSSGPRRRFSTGWDRNRVTSTCIPRWCAVRVCVPLVQRQDDLPINATRSRPTTKRTSSRSTSSRS